MLADAEQIVEALVAKALEGDVGSASVILSKVIPTLKAQSEKVVFAFDATATLSEQVAQVLDSMASGEVAPDQARAVIDSIKALADVRLAEEFEARLVALEARPT